MVIFRFSGFYCTVAKLPRHLAWAPSVGFTFFDRGLWFYNVLIRIAN